MDRQEEILELNVQIGIHLVGFKVESLGDKIRAY